MGQNFSKGLGVFLLFFIATGGIKAGTDYPPNPLSDVTGGSSIISPDNDPQINLFLLYGDAMGFAPYDFNEDMSVVESSLDTDQRNAFRHEFSGFMTFKESKSLNLVPPVPTNSAMEILQKFRNTIGAYSWYYIAQCQSLVGGDRDFSVGVTKNVEISEKERSQLVESRKQLHLICQNEKKSEEIRWPISIESEAALEFLGYLQASGYFYDEKWLVAANKYQTLLTSSDEWVNEAAHYMFARALINHAQRSGVTMYGNFSNSDIDLNDVSDARDALLNYLSKYPYGRYSDSATGLIRRILWLKSDNIGLAEVYEKILTTKNSSIDHAEMVQEIFDKIFQYPNGLDLERSDLHAAPTILAVRYLRDMNLLTSPLGDELEQKKMYFSSKPDLFNLLLASQAFYQENNAEKVLELIQELDQDVELSSLQFSMQALRGMALSRLRSPQEKDFWIRLLKRPLVGSQRGVIELWLSEEYN